MLHEVSRRTLLRAGTQVAALGIVGSLAGCQNPLGGGSGGERARIDVVPQGADAVVDVDTAALLSDSELRGRVNELLSSASGPNSVEAILDRIRSEAGLDPRGLQETLAFAPFDGGSHGKLSSGPSGPGRSCSTRCARRGCPRPRQPTEARR